VQNGFMTLRRLLLWAHKFWTLVLAWSSVVTFLFVGFYYFSKSRAVVYTA
jgi:hypothetical protein